MRNVVFLFSLLALASPGAAQDDLKSLGQQLLAARARVYPALVHIMNVEEVFAHGERQRTVSTGSGFFIDAKGHVVTNYHVAGQAKTLFVTLPSRRQVRAELIAGDPYTDLAVLRVDPGDAFPDGKPVFASFGDSAALQEGEFVMAMGSPLSLARSVSFGIISCRDRMLSTMSLAGHETGKYNTWLQTDAAINPGNSGGPLVNLAGEIVGVNTRANLAADNIGFAIPSNVVRDVVAALLEHRTVPRASIGVTLQPIGALEDTAMTAGREGVLVAAVEAGSPAERAGLRPGDFLTHLADQPFTARFDEELPSLYDRIAKLPLDQRATFVIRRGRISGPLSIQPEPLGRSLGRESLVAAWGITVRGITERMGRQLGLPDTNGVLVTGIRAGSPASGKLERGEIVRNIQGADVTDLAGFLEAAGKSVRARETFVRVIVRRGAVLDVAVLRPAFGEEEEEK